MKKLQIATNGHPRTNNDLVHLQEAIMEIGSALGSLCTDAAGTNTLIIIGGFKYTSLGGGLFTIGDGWLFYNGEVFYFPGAGASLDPPDYFRISSTYAANNPYLGKNIHNIRTMIPIYGSSISGDVAYSALTYGVNNIAKKNLGAWISVYANGSANYPRLANGAVGNGGAPVQFRKNGDGSVEMKGQVMLPAGWNGSIKVVEFGGLLNVNFGEVQVGCATAHLGSVPTIIPVRIYTDGVHLQLSNSYTTVSGDWVYIAPLRFYQSS